MENFVLVGIVIGVFASLTQFVISVIFGTIAGLIKRNANRKALETLRRFNDELLHHPLFLNNSDEEDEDEDYED